MLVDCSNAPFEFTMTINLVSPIVTDQKRYIRMKYSYIKDYSISLSAWMNRRNGSNIKCMQKLQSRQTHLYLFVKSFLKFRSEIKGKFVLEVLKKYPKPTT